MIREKRVEPAGICDKIKEETRFPYGFMKGKDVFKERILWRLVHIYYTGTNGSAGKFAQEMVSCGVVQDIRAQEGNLRYEYFFPMDDKETVLLIDSWKDQQALDIHHASPMMEKIAALREKYDLHMKVERYVPDEGTRPAEDRAFIRE